MSIAAHNDVLPAADDHTTRLADPLGPVLRGLLTMEELVASGDLRVTDTAPGITLLLPGYWLWSQEVKKLAEHYAES
ncbi:hypothetical protein ACF1HU_00715 [Streptomyces olivaceus]|uniref:hypothetical protein n=1 Tax=Streptomyces olivaceus TaxID=47716 RepID=UPI000694E722|nr:hypothetical protein [Streptomyces olivaceus]MBZ6104124.1 hypothetical protein [Streptomyces olivaceus]